MIPAILAGVGAVGSLASAFKGSPQYQAPTFDQLRRTNPELFERLMSIQARANQLQQIADQRKGITAAQQFQMQDTQRMINQQMANRGLLGTSAGMQSQSDNINRARAGAMDQSYNQRMQALNQAGNADMQFLQGSQMAMAPLQQQAQMQHQDALQRRQGQNQFFSGLMGAGMDWMGTDRMLPDGMFPQTNEFFGGMWDRMRQQPQMAPRGPQGNGMMQYAGMPPQMRGYDLP